MGKVHPECSDQVGGKEECWNEIYSKLPEKGKGRTVRSNTISEGLGNRGKRYIIFFIIFYHERAIHIYYCSFRNGTKVPKDGHYLA